MPWAADGAVDGGAAPTHWAEMLEQCRSALSALPGVRVLAVVGSGADDVLLDAWSDLDLVLVVSDDRWQDFSHGSHWLTPMGDLFAVDTSSGSDRYTVRACFTDLRRVDFIVLPESRLPAFARAPGPLQGGVRVVLDRTGGAWEAALSLVPRDGPDAAGVSAAEDFRRLEREFRWNGVLASVKLGRGDLWIAGHLALEMAQSCLVLGMLLRDRAVGTRHHRHGDGVAPPVRLPSRLTAEGVADLIVAAVECWAALGARWDPAYIFPAAPLLTLLGRAPGIGEEADARGR